MKWECKCGSKKFLAEIQTFKNHTDHINVRCASCNVHLGYASQGKTEYVFQFGRHRGKTVQEIAMIDRSYLEWFAAEGKESQLAYVCADYLLNCPEDNLLDYADYVPLAQKSAEEEQMFDNYHSTTLGHRPIA